MNSRNEKTDGPFATLTSVDEVLEVHPGLTTQPTFWPSEPHALEAQSSKEDWKVVLWDRLLCLAPLLLIVKAILVLIAWLTDTYHIEKSILDVSSLTAHLLEFNTQLTTLFTLIFVVIVSTLVRRIALWRAQEGATVVELEQWQASISLTSTLKVIYSLRSWTRISLGLVILWSWYYLGSQACAREYRYYDSGPTKHVNVTYMNTRGPSAFDGDYFSHLTNAERIRYNAQFMVAMWDPSTPSYFVNTSGTFDTAEAPYDVEGAIKVTYISPRFLTWGGPFTDVGGPFASSVGLRLFLDAASDDQTEYITTRAIGRLTYDTSYLGVQCSPAIIRNVSEYPASTLSSMSVSFNLTDSGGNFSQSNSVSNTGPATFDIWYTVDNSSFPFSVVSSTCKIITVPLQLDAKCAAVGCYSTKQTVGPDFQDVMNQTVFNNNSFSTRFFNELLLSTGVPIDENDHTSIEAFTASLFTDSSNLGDLNLLNNTLSGNYTGFDEHRWDVTSPEEVNAAILQDNADSRSTQMTELINTYLNIYQRARLDRDLPSMPRAVYTGGVETELLTRTILTGNFYYPQYGLSIPWLVIDFISCIILFLAAVVSARIGQKTLAPDIFGYVSSLTRDNPNVRLPEAGSTLSGMARTRLLGKTKVQIADVSNNAPVGKVSLVQIGDAAPMPAARLKIGRQYV